MIAVPTNDSPILTRYLKKMRTKEQLENVAYFNKLRITVIIQEKRLKKINDIIKEHATKQFREGDKKVEVKGSAYVWTLARSEKEVTTYHDDAMKADGVFDKYTTINKDTSYRMTVSAIKKEAK